MKPMPYRLLNSYVYGLPKSWSYMTGIKGFNIHTEFIDLYPTGRMKLIHGFVWNGASWAPDKNAIQSSAFHDAFYQLFFLKLLDKKYRKAVDQLLRKMLIEEGMRKFLASIYYRAVRMFGRKVLNSTKPEKIYTAP